MKVLHILGELNPSGAETMLFAAAPLLKDFAINAEILSTGSHVGPYAEKLANAGYAIHHIAFKKNPLFFLAVFKLLNRNSYDAIHLHTERANFWLGGIALLSGKSCIRTIHNTFPFTGILGWKRRWQRQLLKRFGLTHVAISQSVQDTERRHYRMHIPIIQNWYNSLHFRRTSLTQRTEARLGLNIAADSFVLVSIGNCSPVKNHRELIKAMAAVGQQNWAYLHIGIEKDNSERDLATELGIAERIRFYGLQTDILPYLQAADLFVMPSVYEGFGIAAIEAIATGLPTLLTDVPGLADFKTVFDGLFYCEPDSESIAKALSRIISLNQQQIRRRCNQNPIIAEKKFGIDRGLSSYVEMYKQGCG